MRVKMCSLGIESSAPEACSSRLGSGVCSLWSTMVVEANPSSIQLGMIPPGARRSQPYGAQKIQTNECFPIASMVTGDTVCRRERKRECSYVVSSQNVYSYASRKERCYSREQHCGPWVHTVHVQVFVRPADLLNSFAFSSAF